MRITRLRLDNWRNFRTLDLPLRSRAFLVGPNASGKSNILDAVLFLRDLAAARGGGLRAAVEAPRRGSVKALRCLLARATSDVAIDVEIGDDHGPTWRYELRFNADSRRRPVVVREAAWHYPTNDTAPIFARPGPDEVTDPELLTETYLEQTSANKAFRPVAEFFRSIRYLHPVPQMMRESGRFEEDGAEAYGTRLLADIAAANTNTRNARLKRMNEVLRIAVPQLDELQLELDRGVPHLKAKYVHWRPQGAWQREDQFSDGTLRLLGLVWVLMEQGGPLLLEEPELSLHSRIVEQLASVIWRASRKRGRQCLVTTHADALLMDESIGLDEVFVLRPGENGTEVLYPAQREDIRAMLESGMPLPHAVMPLSAPEDIDRLPLFAGNWT